jgi:hypothetical protein
VEVQEYVNLWERIHSIERNEEMDDQFTWCWTMNDEHSTKSAYHIQVTGRFKILAITPIWKATAEPKCKIYA